MMLKMLALKWAITEKFRNYLLVSKFIVYTDKIHYRSGKLSANAYALSRTEVLDSETMH